MSFNKPEPSITPNKVIQDPKKRKAVNNILSVVGLALGTVMVVDLASDHFDISAWTEPIFIGYAYVAAFFGLGVTRPNYPKF